MAFIAISAPARLKTYMWPQSPLGWKYYRCLIMAFDFSRIK